jgi:hypothetical protein
METYIINEKKFVLEELTVGEFENIISLLGLLDVNVPSNLQALSDEAVSRESLKKLKNTLSIGDLINNLFKMLGSVGSNGILSNLLSIILTEANTQKKEKPEFFVKTKRTVAMKALKDFLSGEGKQLVTGIIELMPLNKPKEK